MCYCLFLLKILLSVPFWGTVFFISFFFPELYEPALKRNGIYEYFKAFVTVSEVKRGKGFPDIYEKAAEKLSLPPETCVVYEDILAGIRGAKMGGFAAVGVYDRSGEGNRAKMEQEADRYVTSFKELMNGGDSFF